MRLLVAVVRRELVSALRSPAALLNPLVFFLMVVSLFPLGVGPTASTLQQIAPGVVWVSALLATLLSMEMMFRSDYEDGSLEQMVLGSEPLLVVVLGKVIGHWLLTGLPLALLSPLLAMMLFLNESGAWALLLSLLLGTPVLSLLGAIGASLTVGLRRGGVLITVLILPLFVPVLILASAMVVAGIQGASVEGHALWLGVILALSVGFAPLATMAGVRIAVSQ